MTPSEGEAWIRSNPDATQEILNRVGYPRKLVTELGITQNKRNVSRFIALCKELGLKYSNSNAEVVNGEKYCRRCLSWKPETEFSIRSAATSGRASACSACKNKDQRSRWLDMDEESRRRYVDRNKLTKKELYERKRAIMIKWLTEHPCSTCGETDIVVLEFAHIDRATKADNVTAMMDRSLSSLQAEIGKCKSLCANCHRRETAIENDSYRLHPERYGA